MKRLKFKQPLNGLENAIGAIPESYKVNKKVFEMTDGNENYRFRWEGSLTEGKAITISATDKTLVKEDMANMKHLMGFKSDLGTLTGKERLSEDAIFKKMYATAKNIGLED